MCDETNIFFFYVFYLDQRILYFDKNEENES